MIDLRLLALGFIGLSGLGISALFVQRAHEREQQWRARAARILTTQGKTTKAPELARFRIATRPASPLSWRNAMTVFGIHPERHRDYPLRWWVVLPIGLLGARFVAGILADFLGVGAFFLIPPFWIFFCRQVFAVFDQRRRDALFSQFPDALAMIVRSVRVGIPVSEAIRLVAREGPDPTRREFGLVADKIAIGKQLEEALQQLGTHNDLPEYRFFATALSLQSQTGGGLAETLENLADVIRKRVAMRERGHALASEAKTSAGILAALPIIAGAGLAVLNPSYLSVLLFEPTGKRLLAIAVAMLAGGILVMRSIIRRSLT